MLRQVAFTDSILSLVKAVQGDSLSLDDNVSNKTKSLKDDMYTVLDNYSFGVKPSIAEIINLTDDLTKIIRQYQSDLLNLADAISIKAGLPSNEVLLVLEDIALEISRGQENEALSIAEDLAMKILKATDDSLSTSDNYSLEVQPKYDDIAFLTDSIVANVKIVLSDFQSAIDDLKLKASPVNDDMTYIDDVIGFKIQKALNDAIDLADDISKNIGIIRPIAAVFGTGRFTDSEFGMINGDSISISDNLTYIRGLGLLLEDVLSALEDLSANIKSLLTDDAILNDDILKKVQNIFTEDISLTEDNSNKVNTLLLELLSMSDDILKKAIFSIADTISINDDFYNIAKLVISDLIESGDVIDSIKTGKLIAELITLDDDKTYKISKFIDDTTSIVEELIKNYSLNTNDVIDIAEQLALKIVLDAFNDNVDISDSIERLIKFVVGSTFGMAQFGISGFDEIGEKLQVDDIIKFKASIALADSLGVLDEIANKIQTGANDISDIIDDLILKALPKASEILGISDELLQIIMEKSIDEAISLVEDIYKNMDSAPSNDMQVIADNIVLSLQMKRQMDGLIEVLDSAYFRFIKICDEVLTIMDDYYFKVKSAKDEVISLVELLGIKATKEMAENPVGIIDEYYIRALLGFEELPIGLSDSLKGRKVTLLQQVFIQGVQVPVINLRIQHSAKERVSTCSFTIPSPTIEVLNLARQRAEVKVYLVDGDGITDYFGGRIVNNPVSARSSITSEIQITVDDWTSAAHDVFVSEHYTSEDGTLTDIVKKMWQKYFGYPINVNEVVHSEKSLDNLIFNYDTLFDATEKIAQLLGWVWYVEWNGSERILRFFLHQLQ
ncbi:hypothetical protein [Caloramator sp. Dgby_cultured_2]|uniref:hypothetical protein n=1 Tax=Caloramator sp. Dgby_cultured_2 TaxID=3029174 RepID=UPI00237DE12B|nr:hypothetical protein [Caloramator sp. Dgby_cultured_2]WDU84197.1 hypothetical protein PWK10_07720 [Caloramator sp. Dgby_cultured_2]